MPKSLSIGQMRLTWPEIPEHVRAMIEECIGARFVEALDKSAGFFWVLLHSFCWTTETRYSRKRLGLSAIPTLLNFSAWKLPSSATFLHVCQHRDTMAETG